MSPNTATGSAGLFNPVTGHRILDTRNGTGGVTSPVTSGHTVAMQVTGVGGIPSAGVGAVVFNLTVTQPSAAGYVTAYPDGVSRPLASNLNFAAGETIANRVMIPVVDGKVDLYLANASAQLIVDVSGYFTTAPPPAAAPTSTPRRRSGSRTPAPEAGCPTADTP